MVGFMKHNANPKGKRTGDCVIRAITVATGIPYSQVVTELTKIHLETGHDSHSKQAYEKYLISLGWIKHKQPVKLDGSKYKVGEINLLIRPYERAIISMANHLSVKLGTNVYDTWDCRKKTIGNYFTHPKDSPYSPPINDIESKDEVINKLSNVVKRIRLY